VRNRKPRQQVIWKSAAARRLLKMAGNPATVEEAVTIVADRLLEGVPCPPTDLESIALRLNITGFRAEDVPFSGELRPDGAGFTVIYSSALSPGRRRFTVAHEMAHALFETSGRNCPRVGRELERLCDKIAAELLMPRMVFLQCVGPAVSVGGVFELARLFGLSLSATAIRCAELKGVTVFEVEGDAVTWGHGIIKRGSIRALEYVFRHALLRALPLERGSTLVYLSNRVWTGEWQLEWARLGQGRRTLFLLQPDYSSRRANGGNG
jgi:IrrE N-terminal-like domain